LTVTGFVPGETVYRVIASTPRIQTTGVADGTGAASLPGVIPSDIGAGDHTVALYAPGSGHGARQAITVTVTLPRTGTSWVVSLWAGVLVGGGLMLWRTTRCSRSASMPTDVAH
jgi:LPXTG-motif cell wall-anchored protein